MKRVFIVLAVLILLAGCAAQTPQPLPQMKPEVQPRQLAGEMWSQMGGSSAAQPVSLQTVCMLLELGKKDLAEVCGFFDPESSQQGQLFLLQAASGKEEKVRKALEDRLELVRQTAAAWLGTDDILNEYGRLISAGEWTALVIPVDNGADRTGEACQVFLDAFQ